MHTLAAPKQHIKALIAPTMAREVDLLRERIAQRLLHAGVRLDNTELHQLAEAILSDAVSLSLEWLEPVKSSIRSPRADIAHA